MLQLIATLSGIAFGALSAFYLVRSNAKLSQKEWRERATEEIKRQAEAEVKQYAAQRDFEHLRRNQEQLKEAIKLLQEETQEQNETLIEISAFMAAKEGQKIVRSKSQGER